MFEYTPYRSIGDYSVEELAEEIAGREREAKAKEQLEAVLHEISANYSTAYVKSSSKTLRGDYEVTIKIR